MRQLVLMVVAVAAVAGAAGCSIAPGVPFPLQHVTFDREDNYTASWTESGRSRTSTGQYNWNGFTLKVMQEGNLPRKYGARRRLDGRLVLTYAEGEGKVNATLERVKN
jgi:hypothetical protein